MRLGWLCLFCAGCTGSIGDRMPLADDPPIVTPPDDPPLACGALEAPRHRLVHLSRAEYERTVGDLLGVPTDLTATFPEDDAVVGFSAPVNVDATLARNYWQAAEEAAAIAVTRLDVLVPCELATEGCVDRFVSEFGLRAFRRPLAESEVSDYVALYDETIADGDDPTTSLEAVVHAMLASPSFLYRVEIPPDGSVRALDDYEIASRLSYFLWGTMPDELLFDAAARGALRDVDARAIEVDRMLADERARQGLTEFVGEWLQLSHLDHFTFAEGVVPGVETEEQQAALRTRMREQAIAFVERIFFDGAHTFEELMTSRTFEVDDTLAPLLRIAPPGRVADAELRDRAGLLTLPATLAAHGGSFSGGTSPIKRGVWLLDRILCLPHPPPLPQLPDYCSATCDGGCAEGTVCADGLCIADGATTCSDDADCNLTGGMLGSCHSSGRCIPNPAFCIPRRQADQTTRQWWDSFGGGCHGCHAQINGIGYGLESYDGVGRYRETERTSEGDEPIDDSGEVLGAPEGRNGPFVGAQGLVDKMIESELGQECLSRSWFVHAFGQLPGGHQGAECTARLIDTAFRESGYDLRALVRAIALSDGFAHSAPTEDP